MTIAATNTAVTAPAPTNRSVARIFDKQASAYDDASNPYTLRRRVEALAPLVTGRSLEVGGGTAAITSALKDKSSAFHSDIAPEMCRVASQKIARPSLCFDAETIPLRNSSIDTLISSEMIYYLAHPRLFIDEAHRVLTPGGKLLICTTNPLATILEKGRTLLRKLGFRNMFFDDGSPDFIPMRRITTMLETAGLIVEQKRCIIPLPFAKLDPLNRFLEKTPMSRLGLFMIITATRPG